MSQSLLPVADRTWSAYTAFAATDEQSAIFTFKFPRPVELIGSLPSIADTATGATRSALLADLLLAVSDDAGTRYSQQSGKAILNASDYVDAEAWDTRDRRRLGIVFAEPSELVIEARWKIPAFAAANFNATVIGLCVWGRFITREQAAELITRYHGLE